MTIIAKQTMPALSGRQESIEGDSVNRCLKSRWGTVFRLADYQSRAVSPRAVHPRTVSGRSSAGAVSFGLMCSLQLPDSPAGFMESRAGHLTREAAN
jgi:hypothetical protein